MEENFYFYILCMDIHNSYLQLNSPHIQPHDLFKRINKVKSTTTMR